jgi:benzylsuccinate CoA-transferase BbsF subunit
MTDAQWGALKTLMNHPQWAASEELNDASGRAAHKALLEQNLSSWTQNQDAYDLMARCQAAGVPAGVVQDGADLLERDPQLADVKFARRMVDEHPDLGPTWVDALPIHFAKTPCQQYERVRAIGEDNAAVLQDWLGMPAEEIATKEKDGVLQ